MFSLSGIFVVDRSLVKSGFLPCNFPSKLSSITAHEIFFTDMPKDA